MVYGHRPSCVKPGRSRRTPTVRARTGRAKDDASASQPPEGCYWEKTEDDGPSEAWEPDRSNNTSGGDA